MSINVDEIDEDLKGLLDDESSATSPRNNTPLPITQKMNAKKKAYKEKKKILQLQTPSELDEQVVPTFSAKSPEYIPFRPSGSRLLLIKVCFFLLSHLLSS
ncbi:hypothetical protein RclHR1_05170012 [Rhizophagus clarus]|uniref:Uncharacterized protein n=1 Tax=Rhizophagus clarus TaxID=94130 RepID=A0A2Z6S4C5_9GLOM|nr:hypothetical protein RclHR1_05170012 [Rhizophagus clarus]